MPPKLLAFCRRLAGETRIIDRLTLLGEEGMASGIDDTFDIDAFVTDELTSLHATKAGA